MQPESAPGFTGSVPVHPVPSPQYVELTGGQSVPRIAQQKCIICKWRGCLFSQYIFVNDIIIIATSPANNNQVLFSCLLEDVSSVFYTLKLLDRFFDNKMKKRSNHKRPQCFCGILYLALRKFRARFTVVS